MILEMILSVTENASQRLLLVTGGFTGGVVGFFTQDMPSILLMLTWHQVIDIALTGGIGALVGWCVHITLNWCRRKYNKRCKKS